MSDCSSLTFSELWILFVASCDI